MGILPVTSYKEHNFFFKKKKKRQGQVLVLEVEMGRETWGVCETLMLCVNETMGDSVLVMYLSFILKKKKKRKKRVMYLGLMGWNLRWCLVTVFVFYFQNFIFGNIKKKQFFVFLK